MNVLMLTTSSNETLKYLEGIASLKLGNTHAIAYDIPSLGDGEIFAACKEYKPGMLVYVGSRWSKTIAPTTLARLNAEVAPTVHICSDAADTPWWDLLKTYHYAGSFALQVAIDGSKKWPLADSQMTALTPVDPVNFPAEPVPHAERRVMAGYGGNSGMPGGIRRVVLESLLAANAIQTRQRSDLNHTYQGYCDFLAGVRISVNIAQTGTEAALHVKGRVIESALAGAMLLETAGSPTQDWFEPEVDYMTYASPEQAVGIITRMSEHPVDTQAMAERLRAKVLAEHTPAKFWARIMDRIGVKP